MKLHQLSILVILLFSCSEENTIQSGNQTSSNKTIEKVLGDEEKSITVLFENDSIQPENLVTDSVYKEFDFGGDFPTTVDLRIQFYNNALIPYQDSVNKIVEKSIKIQTFSDSSDYSILNKRLLDLCTETFIDEFKLNLGLYENQDYLPTAWVTEINFMIAEKKDFVEVSDASWSFLGGAHGNGRVYYYNIDKKTGNQMTLENFFTDIEELTKIGEQYFRSEYSEDYPNIIDWSEDFWFESDQFELLNNFSIGEKSIYFAINQYDIASYAQGRFDFEIPLEKVEHLLKERFKLNYK